jgi:hypothetical protein
MSDETQLEGASQAPADAGTQAGDPAHQAGDPAHQAGDPAHQAGDPAHQDTIEGLRAQLEKEKQRSRKIGKKLDRYERRLHGLPQGDERRLGAERTDGREASSDEPPSWAKLMMGELAEVKTQLASAKNAAEDRARKAIMAKIPEAMREDAEDMLAGLVARKKIDLSDPGAVDAALTRLNHLTRDPERPSPFKAPQIGPDQKVDWSLFEKWDEIPPDFRGRVPDAVAARLSGRGANGSRHNPLGVPTRRS